MDNYPYFSAMVAIYLIGFAVLHSLMASLKAKSMARRLIGSKVDPWYSVLFISVAIVTVLPLAAMMILMLIVDPGDVIYFVPSPWIWFFFLAQLIVGLSSLKAFLDAPHRFLILHSSLDLIVPIHFLWELKEFIAGYVIPFFCPAFCLSG